VAAELGTQLGETVGYQVRFTDRVSRATRVKLMTDGILLAELERDRNLRRYDTIIIDEAHERSLNVDFLLGYLARLHPRRPDLKLIITSATIDPDRFSRHFGGAPVVDVAGRTYPVAGRSAPPRRRRRALPRGAGRRPGLPLGGAGDPRPRRRPARARVPAQPRRGRHPAPVRPAGRRRAAPGVPAPRRAAGGAGHQRGRGPADRARGAVRGRPGHGPDLPLQPPVQGPAAAHRTDLPGIGQPPQGPRRAHRRRAAPP